VGSLVRPSDRSRGRSRPKSENRDESPRALGYDAVEGYLAGGFSAWSRSGRAIGRLETWSVAMLKEALEKERFILIDVREQKNRDAMGFVMGSRHIYIGELVSRLAEIPKHKRSSYTAMPDSRGVSLQACFSRQASRRSQTCSVDFRHGRPRATLSRERVLDEMRQSPVDSQSLIKRCYQP